MDAIMDNCVHGFHMYQSIICYQQSFGVRKRKSNREDRHIIAIYKSKEIVSYIPHMISSLCAACIRWGGIINCAVEGDHCYNSDQAQGGIKIPYKLIFKGPVKELQNLKIILIVHWEFRYIFKIPTVTLLCVRLHLCQGPLLP